MAKKKAAKRKSTPRTLAPGLPTNWPDIVAFAQAFASKDSPTRGRGVASMLVVFPNDDYETARRKSFRWRGRPDVREEIERVEITEFAERGADAKEWAAKIYVRADWLLHRGRPGDAAAAARLFGLVAEALGLRTKQVVDLTPPERRGLTPLTGNELAGALLAQMEQMKRLREPVPMPQAEEIEVEEVKRVRKADWPPHQRDTEGVFRVTPPCIVCQAQPAIEFGDGQYRCATHAREWAQSLLPRPEHVPEDRTGSESPV